MPQQDKKTKLAKHLKTSLSLKWNTLHMVGLNSMYIMVVLLLGPY